VLWATDWQHTGVRRGTPPPDPFAVVPFQPIADARALDELKSWAGTAERLQQILVDNPARLYGF
jgi:predicted TIM-barrel fold metal-dependent hydrolase